MAYDVLFYYINYAVNYWTLFVFLMY